MAFLIYEIYQIERGLQYRSPQKIEANLLAGALVDYFRAENIANSGIHTWHVSESDILPLLSVSPSSHALVFDIKPEVNRNVSLCRLKDIWGFSNLWWTPVLLELESIFIDKEDSNPQEYKKSFNDDEAEREILREFLYLGAGTSFGRRCWGKTGYVNAALLWPDALRHFFDIIKERL